MAGLASDFLPDVTGRNLGSASQQWNAFIQTLTLSGALAGTPSIKNLNGIRFADQFTGASPTIKIDAALADSGCKIVIVTSALGAGNATSIGTGQAVIDLRATPQIFTNVSASVPAFTISDAGIIKMNNSQLVGRDTTDTLTNKTLTAPVISTIVNTGTLTVPTTAGTLALVPTVVVKKGSGGGNYTTPADTNYHDVDAANLSYTVTIPTGSKLVVNVYASGYTATAATNFYLSLYDGATLAEVICYTPLTVSWTSCALGTVITGDGASHTVKLQFKTSDAADAATLLNVSATATPVMIFTLLGAN